MMEKMKTDYKHIYFDELEPKAKTKQFAVRNVVSSGDILGYVKWYSQWRRYCFFTIPSSGIVFDEGCLSDIQDFIKNLMLERKKQQEYERLKSIKHGLDITSIEGN
jgi:predicted N-acyltransferase